jgi:hypothetical protein
MSISTASACLPEMKRRPRAVSVARRDEDDERHGQQRERGERRLEHEHGDRAERDRQRALQDEHQPVAEEEAHRREVDGRARHQLAGLLAGEEPELELLQVRVEQVAEVELDRQRHAAGDEPPRDRQPEPRQGDDDDGDREVAQAGAVVRRDAVDGAAGQPRDGDRARHRGRREEQRPRHPGLVGPQEAEEPGKGAHATNTRARASQVRSALGPKTLWITLAPA